MSPRASVKFNLSAAMPSAISIGVPCSVGRRWPYWPVTYPLFDALIGDYFCLILGLLLALGLHSPPRESAA